MAVPKRKVSKARRDKRRSSVWKLGAPTLTECPQCHVLKAPHKACPECGYVNADLSVKDGKITVTLTCSLSTSEKKVYLITLILYPLDYT